jgi:hypothetical protein
VPILAAELAGTIDQAGFHAQWMALDLPPTHTGVRARTQFHWYRN